MSRAKTHKTITITDAWLKRKGACLGGRVDVAALLPAVISTDPDDNIEIAERLVDVGHGLRIYWLMRTLNGETTCVTPIDGDYYFNTFSLTWYPSNTMTDVWLIAQWLAEAVDIHLTKRGR